MGQNSSIEWCHHTFNPWIGCAKVSAGCKNCYAETLMDTRYGRVKWGVNGTRQRTSETYWKQPVRWNKDAAAKGIRYRVFCASLADVFEDRPELVQWRFDLFALIDATPNLDWLLLTKRPENIACLWPRVDQDPTMGSHYLIRKDNVWIGTSVENQDAADTRIPHLMKAAHLCRFTFLSCEPLIAPVELTAARLIQGGRTVDPRDTEEVCLIDWVIAGGESGPNARPMHPDWARSLRDQCVRDEVAFLFKQWGEWAPSCAQYPSTDVERAEAEEVGLSGDIALEPDGTIADGYQPISKRTWLMNRKGKHAAGRSLDGVEHNGFPS